MALVIDGARMAELLRGPHGPVVRHATVIADRVQARAREMLVPGHGYKTGRLHDSIVKRVIEVGGNVVVMLWTPGVPYAYHVHEGTDPHPIVAHDRNGKPGTLAFFWANGPTGAHVYFFRSVNHPGTQPIRFLSEPLRAVMATER